MESHVFKEPSLPGEGEVGAGPDMVGLQALEISIWNVAGLHEPQIIHGTWRVYTGPKFYRDVAMCKARDAGADMRSQGLTPATGRVPHLLRVGGEGTAATRTEDSARRLRMPPPPRRSSCPSES